MRNKKEDRRSQRTRRLLHRAVMSLMQEKRYDSITVQDIIDRADVGRSTFYAHYQDKEDLINSSLKEILDELGQHLDDKTPDTQRIVPTLALFKHVYEGQQHFEAMKGRGLDLMLEKGQVYWHKNIKSQLQARFPQEETPALPLDLVASYLSGALSTFLKWWMANNFPYSPERIDEMFQHLVMPGVWAMLGKDEKV